MSIRTLHAIAARVFPEVDPDYATAVKSIYVLQRRTRQVDDLLAGREHGLTAVEVESVKRVHAEMKEGDCG